MDFNLNGVATDDQGESSLKQQISLQANLVEFIEILILYWELLIKLFAMVRFIAAIYISLFENF